MQGGAYARGGPGYSVLGRESSRVSVPSERRTRRKFESVGNGRAYIQWMIRVQCRFPGTGARDDHLAGDMRFMERYSGKIPRRIELHEPISRVQSVERTAG